MKRLHSIVGACLSAALLTACGGRSTVPQTSSNLSQFGITPAEESLTGAHVYWTLFAGSTWPQVQLAAVPLGKHSKATSILNNSQNNLVATSGMHVDSTGRLWILTDGPSYNDPGSVSVFDLPLTSKSTPKYSFILKGTDGPYHLTFDRFGHLWVTSLLNHAVFEYVGPFKNSGTLSPKLRLTKGLSSPEGIAADAHGNLYVANYSGKLTGKDSIAIFPTPVSNKTPKYLDGISEPGGLVFDKHGNLYAADNFGGFTAVERYDSNDLKPGDKPSIIDRKGLPGAFTQVDFALSATGDLYLTNCSSFPGIIVYPTSKQAFSAKLAPSVFYTNSKIKGASCAWGIAIK